ncbi:hypothetical protein V8F06_014849 [Rhypophila decipiens]
MDTTTEQRQLERVNKFLPPEPHVPEIAGYGLRRTRTLANYAFGDEEERCGQDKRQALQTLPDEILVAFALIVRTQKIREASVQVVQLVCEIAPTRLRCVVDMHSGHDQFKACLEEVSKVRKQSNSNTSTADKRPSKKRKRTGLREERASRTPTHDSEISATELELRVQNDPQTEEPLIPPTLPSTVPDSSRRLSNGVSLASRRALSAPASPSFRSDGVPNTFSVPRSGEQTSHFPALSLVGTAAELPQNCARLSCGPGLAPSLHIGATDGTDATRSRSGSQMSELVQAEPSRLSIPEDPVSPVSIILYRNTGHPVIKTVVDHPFRCLYDYMTSDALISSKRRAGGYVCVSWPNRIQGQEFRKVFSTHMIMDVAIVLPPYPDIDFVVGYRTLDYDWLYLRKIIDGLQQAVSSSCWSQGGFVAGVMQGTSDEEYVVIFPVSRQSSVLGR